MTVNAPTRSIGSVNTTLKTSLLIESNGTTALRKSPAVNDGRSPRMTHRPIFDIMHGVTFAGQSDFGAGEFESVY